MNKEKYQSAFVKAFAIQIEEVTPALAYQSIAPWDSVGHMALIAELEEAFDIMMETDDVIDFSSYQAGLEIMLKYGVDINE